MKTVEDVESFLIRMGLPYEDAGHGVWLITGAPGLDNFAITVSGPLVVFRVKVMEVPKQRREQLFHLLLELNASDMVHGAYAIEGDNIVLTDALQLENLDYNEFQGTFDDITMAIANHAQKLEAFRKAA